MTNTYVDIELLSTSSPFTNPGLFTGTLSLVPLLSALVLVADEVLLDSIVRKDPFTLPLFSIRFPRFSVSTIIFSILFSTDRLIRLLDFSSRSLMFMSVLSAACFIVSASLSSLTFRALAALILFCSRRQNFSASLIMSRCSARIVFDSSDIEIPVSPSLITAAPCAVVPKFHINSFTICSRVLSVASFAIAKSMASRVKV